MHYMLVVLVILIKCSQNVLGQSSCLGAECGLCGIQKIQDDPMKLAEQCIHSDQFCSASMARSVPVNETTKPPAVRSGGKDRSRYVEPVEEEAADENAESTTPISGSTSDSTANGSSGQQLFPPYQGPYYQGPMPNRYYDPRRMPPNAMMNPANHINSRGQVRLRDYRPKPYRRLKRGLGLLNRIIGGTNITDFSGGQLCWQVMIKVRSSFWCGGSIVGPRTIVTAAHCLKDENKKTVPASDVKVETGVLSYSTRTDKTLLASKCGQSFTVKTATVHPDYNGASNNNDVAVLILSKDIDLNAKCTCAICLENKEPVQGESCVTSGYGETQDNRPLTSLNWVKLTVLENVKQKCSVATGMKSDLFICAGNQQKKDSCSGDSGGPLMCWNKDRGAYYLAGVVSFGELPCGVGTGGQYTKIARYLDWIKLQARKQIIIPPFDLS